MKMTFKNVVDAEIVLYLPGALRPSGTAVVFSVRDMVEASKLVSAIFDMNRFAP